MKPFATKENIGVESSFLYRLRDPFVILFIFIAYFVTAKLGLMVDAVSGFATLTWLPSGIGFASVLLLGNRVWLAIAWAAFVVNFQNDAPFLTAVGIGLGNSFEALAGAYILNKYTDFRPQLDRQKDVIYLIFAIVVCTIVSATIGSISLAIGGLNSWEGFLYTWTTWWTGDIVGSLLVTPFILVWAKKLRPFNMDWKKLIEPFLLAVGVILSTYMIFGVSSEAALPLFKFISILFPFIVWSALRFCQVGSTSVIFYIYLMALWGTIHGLGPFSTGNLRTDLFSLHGHIATLSATTLFLSSAILERRKALEDLKKIEAKLQGSHSGLENTI